MDRPRRAFLGAVTAGIAGTVAGCGSSGERPPTATNESDRPTRSRTDTSTPSRSPTRTVTDTPFPTRTPILSGECRPDPADRSSVGEQRSIRIEGRLVTAFDQEYATLPFEVTNLGDRPLRPTEVEIQSDVASVSCLLLWQDDDWERERAWTTWRPDTPIPPGQSVDASMHVEVQCGGFFDVEAGGATATVASSPLPCDRSLAVSFDVGRSMQAYDGAAPLDTFPTCTKTNIGRGSSITSRT